MNERRISSSPAVNLLFDAFTNGGKTHFSVTDKRYNVIRDGEKTVVQFALAGFNKEELSVKMTETGYLRVLAEKPEQSEVDVPDYIYKGISDRSISYDFKLPNMRVESSNFVNGILSVVLKKEILEEVTIQID